MLSCPLTCSTHDLEPLISLCLSSDCSNPGLICYLCTLQQHKDHDADIPFKILIGELIKQPLNLVQQICKIDVALQKITIGLQQIVKKYGKINQDSIILETNLNYQNQVKNEINKSISSIDQLQYILEKPNQLQKVKSLNKWFKSNPSLIIYQQKNQKNQSIRTSPLIIYLSDYLSQLESVEQQITEMIINGIFQQIKLLKLLNKEQKEVIYSSGKRLHFSENLMGTNMTLEGPYKINMSVYGSQRMVLLEPSLSNRKIKKWRIKIVKHASWIGVGVSHFDSIKEVNFDFSYTQSNHGNYLISSNGYSWNGFDMSFNSKLESFKFKTDDIIELQYNPKSNQIRFKKEGTNQTYKLEIDPNQKPMNASINLTGVGDCVEIL